MRNTANEIIDFYYNSKENNAALWEMEYQLKEMRNAGGMSGLSTARIQNEIELEKQIEDFKRVRDEVCIVELRQFIQLKLYKKKPLKNPRVTIEQNDSPTFVIESNKVSIDLQQRVLRFGDDLSLSADVKDENFRRVFGSPLFGNRETSKLEIPPVSFGTANIAMLKRLDDFFGIDSMQRFYEWKERFERK